VPRPRPKVGDVVTFCYDSFSRQALPVNPKITRIRFDIPWNNVALGMQNKQRITKNKNKNKNKNKKKNKNKNKNKNKTKKNKKYHQTVNYIYVVTSPNEFSCHTLYVLKL
jgi:hypothetical protein